MKVQCIEDAYCTMEDGSRQLSFIKGNVYRTYEWLMQDGYDYIRTLCAKNEFKPKPSRHVLKYLDDTSHDEFFERHFRIIEKVKK